MPGRAGQWAWLDKAQGLRDRLDERDTADLAGWTDKSGLELEVVDLELEPESYDPLSYLLRTDIKTS